MNNNNNNIQQQNEPPKKKGFDFIKAKSSSNNQQVHKNDVNSLFANTQPQQQNPIDIFNQNQSSPLSSIFSPSNNTPMDKEATQQNSMPTIDLTKITSTYQNNNNATSNPQQPIFNYDLVYQNTEVLKPKTNQNDPFNFVDEMIKI